MASLENETDGRDEARPGSVGGGDDKGDDNDNGGGGGEDRRSFRTRTGGGQRRDEVGRRGRGMTTGGRGIFDVSVLCTAFQDLNVLFDPLQNSMDPRLADVLLWKVKVRA